MMWFLITVRDILILSVAIAIPFGLFAWLLKKIP